MNIKELEKKYKQVWKLSDGNYAVSDKAQDEVSEVDYWNAHTDINAVYGLEGNWGLVDKDGNVVIEPQYIYPFLECGDNYQVMLPYKYQEIDGKEIIVTLKHGLIDKKGNVIIPIKYLFMAALDNTGTYFKAFDIELEKDGVLDKNNQIIVPFEYEYIPSSPALMIHTKYGDIYPEHIYQVKVCNGHLYGVYDLELKKEIIKPQYKYLKIIDYNKFLIGEDYEHCHTLINEKNIEIGDTDGEELS